MAALAPLARGRRGALVLAVTAAVGVGVLGVITWLQRQRRRSPVEESSVSSPATEQAAPALAASEGSGHRGLEAQRQQEPVVDGRRPPPEEAASDGTMAGPAGSGSPAATSSTLPAVPEAPTLAAATGVAVAVARKGSDNAPVASRLSADAPEFKPGSRWAGAAAASAAPPKGPAPSPKPGSRALCERLTVILTTSPVGRHPSTDLIDEVLGSMKLADGLVSCDMVVVCDGYRRENGEGVAYSEPKYRSGIVDAESAKNYEAYKAVLRKRMAGTTAPAIRLLELESRHGFGFAVREALRLVRTPYVLVMQHDRPFTRRADIPRLLAAMEAAPSRFKYVGLPTSTTHGHQYHVLSKYGLRIEPVTADARGLQMVPLIQWYDSAHLCEVEHYRSFVFGPRQLVSRGGFIEDKLGQTQLADIRKRGVAVAHPEYGTFIAAGDGFAEPCVGHLDGRDALNVSKFKFVKAEAPAGTDRRSIEAALRAGSRPTAWVNSLAPPCDSPGDFTQQGLPAKMLVARSSEKRPPTAHGGEDVSNLEVLDPPLQAKSLFEVSGAQRRREWRPCEVLAHDHSAEQYLIRWAGGDDPPGEGVSALQLILEPMDELRSRRQGKQTAAEVAPAPPAAKSSVKAAAKAPAKAPVKALAKWPGSGAVAAAPPQQHRPGPLPPGATDRSKALAPDRTAEGLLCPDHGWQYIDPHQNVQGPFSLVEMQHWNSQGYFTPSLLMRCCQWDQFVAFAELFPPSTVPFQSYPKRPAKMGGRRD
mmetsp:Transcript_8558/g.18982  ORF Transcript_8558/g.18982 Transcript_8558/m.18982 type:complete len:759 (+) Transcript_8558:46-2322(+)